MEMTNDHRRRKGADVYRNLQAEEVIEAGKRGLQNGIWTRDFRVPDTVLPFPLARLLLSGSEYTDRCGTSKQSKGAAMAVLLTSTQSSIPFAQRLSAALGI